MAFFRWDADTIKGKLYDILVDGEVIILVYHKDIFEKLGLKPPLTLEELKENTKKFIMMKKTYPGALFKDLEVPEKTCILGHPSLRVGVVIGN